MSGFPNAQTAVGLDALAGVPPPQGAAAPASADAPRREFSILLKGGTHPDRRAFRVDWVRPHEGGATAAEAVAHLLREAVVALGDGCTSIAGSVMVRNPAAAELAPRSGRGMVAALFIEITSEDVVGVCGEVPA